MHKETREIARHTDGDVHAHVKTMQMSLTIVQCCQMVALQSVQGTTCLTHHFLIFRHLGTMALSPERQSARMSEIKNDGLDQYGHERLGRLIFCHNQTKVWD